MSHGCGRTHQDHRINTRRQMPLMFRQMLSVPYLCCSLERCQRHAYRERHSVFDRLPLRSQQFSYYICRFNTRRAYCALLYWWFLCRREVSPLRRVTFACLFGIGLIFGEPLLVGTTMDVCHHFVLAFNSSMPPRGKTSYVLTSMWSKVDGMSSITYPATGHIV